ncbi:sulfotransferase [Falsirhodobacter algicola]|uniref:Sulfotransferase family protein n=1 Tax=Falsirhodobacter algicola TaxID=2692330 RepID=A0A8J8MRP7_9RHOB|nr:sulfotransferase [Falsirhodobacter algicola]QUS35522.1 sulfotransferase family protein [Falsirhodobacter algicola]
MTRQPTILLGVGATKSGTTWLFDQLASHPDCHLRAIKELHYFDTFAGGRWKRQLPKLEARAAKAGGRLRDDLQQWIGVMRRGRLCLRDYLGYLSEGRGDRGLIGDITPSYSLLPARILRRVASMGDVRVLYLMRDPVARLWSQVRMDAKRAATHRTEIAGLAQQMLDRALAGQGGAWMRSDYAGALKRLDAAVDPRKLCVAFYETLMTPQGFDRITSFLGIAPHRPDFAKRVHGGVDVTLSQADRARALTALRPQYDAVARRAGELPAAWQASLAGV